MAFCKAYTLPGKEGKSCIKWLKSPVLCILRRKMSALVTINNVWNSKQEEKCLGEAWYSGFSMCRDMCDLDLYFGYLWGNKRKLE